MKTLIQMVFVLTITIQIQAQEKIIRTESITIENVIPFMVEEYASPSEGHNITLLIETTKRNFTSEEGILLKQAVKYVSEQLSEDDYISIVAYNNLNGIVLEQTSAKSLKKLLNVINDFSSHLSSKTNDGITLAYNYANENYKEDIENTVIMIRNPNGSKVITSQELSKTSALENTEAKRPKNNMVLLTAIAVLPELIAIIKD
ncbi:hypothetical protein ACFS5M_08685 [Lacinutrix iliipiscaria]|uniref:VWFA domain-containing protein n=1 Tax=Lacinutrix iliipiscaria TaxID=1230532 RepID=A0ABW5WLY6_9FLAO